MTFKLPDFFLVFDKALSGLRLWRRRRGGVWFRLCELPQIQGGFTFWTRELRPGIPGYVIAVEDYSEGLRCYRLGAEKTVFAGGMFPAARWK